MKEMKELIELDINEMMEIDGGGATQMVAGWLFGELGGKAGGVIGSKNHDGKGIGGAVGSFIGSSVSTAIAIYGFRGYC